MPKYVALLRGINVGGHKPVPMDRLRRAFEALGFRNVKTLLASGNVLFETPSTNAAALVKKIEAKLEQTFGHEIGTIVRTLGELQKLAGLDPFKGIKVTPATRLFVTFLSEEPNSSLTIPYVSPDKNFRILRVTGGEVCSVLVVGPQLAKNMHWMGMLEKEFGKKITTRSWNTVVRVLKASGQAL
jgi:uncharacterized protein (DUF1697 family)